MPSTKNILPAAVDEAELYFAALRYLTSVIPAIKYKGLPQALRKIFPENAEMMLKTLKVVDEVESWEREREKEWERGQLEEAQRLAILLLRKKLGTLSETAQKCIYTLTVTQLEELVIDSTDLRTDKDLQAWLRARRRAR